MKTLLVAGARPNFMKIAPIYRQSRNFPRVDCRIVHTGQHYDHAMSQAFFDDLDIPAPAFRINSGSGTHAEQTARIMVDFEGICRQFKPDLVMVVGDVNSTLACSIAAKKLCIEVAHVEAGLRSFDMTMPEEINRMVTDAIADHFFVTEESGRVNLLREGKPESRIHFVGHVMIDNLIHQVNQLETMELTGLSTYAIKPSAGPYAFLTLHRPSNVDDAKTFRQIAEALNRIAADMPVFFPVHPRTKKMIAAHGINLSEAIVQLDPLGFKEALFLWKDARVVLTDSGGLQEESTALKIPCLTLRNNTERPITVEMGSNILAGTSTDSILDAYREAMARGSDNHGIPPKWDGKASERIWLALLGEPSPALTRTT